MTAENIYKKLNKAKDMLLSCNMKKSGKNAFAKFEYYELSDILPHIVKVCKETNLATTISFDNENAILTLVNCDNPQETIAITSTMRELDLKGCNAIQALGGVETYQRRYLYMACFDIVENDLFDATSGKTTTTSNNKPAFEQRDSDKADMAFEKLMREKGLSGIDNERLKYFSNKWTNAMTPEEKKATYRELMEE
jgi:hypothetical protein